MKVLLDENLPRRLRSSLAPHEVFTVRYKGWAGLRDGELLQAAEKDNFDVFITGDQSLISEQNLSGRQLAVLVLTAIEWHFVRRCLPHIAAVLKIAGPGTFHVVQCGIFSRKHPRD